MAQIQVLWPKSKQDGPNLARKPKFGLKVRNFGPFDPYCASKARVQLTMYCLWAAIKRYDLYYLDMLLKDMTYTI